MNTRGRVDEFKLHRAVIRKRKLTIPVELRRGRQKSSAPVAYQKRANAKNARQNRKATSTLITTSKTKRKPGDTDTRIVMETGGKSLALNKTKWTNSISVTI